MLCHFSYVLEALVAEVESIYCLGTTHIHDRMDENNNKYKCTADDAAYVIMELKGGIVAQFNTSWCVRVRRDDLLTLQVDGTEGSAVTGLQKCWSQSYEETPRCVWNPDVENPFDFQKTWKEVGSQETFDNAFKTQWELFLRHVILDEPFRYTFLEGAKNILLAEKAIESWEKQAKVPIPKLDG
jgi:predicted dehydrogenase